MINANHIEITNEPKLAAYSPLASAILRFTTQKGDATLEDLVQEFSAYKRGQIFSTVQKLEVAKLIRRKPSPRRAKYVEKRNKYTVFEVAK